MHCAMRKLTEVESPKKLKPLKMDMDHDSIDGLNSINVFSTWRNTMEFGVSWYHFELKTYLILISLDGHSS